MLILSIGVFTFDIGYAGEGGRVYSIMEWSLILDMNPMSIHLI